MERDGLKEDMLEECSKFGTVQAIKIPLAGNDDASLYVKWSAAKEAAAALKSFANRKFDGRVVAVSHVPEADFHTLKDGE